MSSLNNIRALGFRVCVALVGGAVEFYTRAYGLSAFKGLGLSVWFKECLLGLQKYHCRRFPRNLSPELLLYKYVLGFRV